MTAAETYGGRLLTGHAEKLATSAVSREVAAERGYVSADNKAQLERAGFGLAQRRPPALVIPLHGVVTEHAGQLHPGGKEAHHPRSGKDHVGEADCRPGGRLPPGEGGRRSGEELRLPDALRPGRRPHSCRAPEPRGPQCRPTLRDAEVQARRSTRLVHRGGGPRSARRRRARAPVCSGRHRAHARATTR